MSRFTLSQLLMGIALIVIVLVFTQTEGCGRRLTMIESLTFSSDDSRILVTKLNARDARTPGKLYKANLSRTVSWLDVFTGNRGELIHQDYTAGNCGPAFEFWRVGRTSATCNPSNDHIAMSAFGGGDSIRYVGKVKSNVVTLAHSAYNIAYSKSGKFLAAKGIYELTVLDTENDTVVMRVHDSDFSGLNAPLMSFTNDDRCVILAGDSSVQLWDLATSMKRSTVCQGLEPWISYIAVTANDTLILCSDDWVRRYDFAGNVVATLADKGAALCSIASDGRRLAVSHDDGVTIYDLNTNTALRSFSCQRSTALALSSNGDELAVGDFRGRVALIDIATGAQRWYSSPSGRYRWPWTLPGAVLLVWIYFVRRLSPRPKIVGAPDTNTGMRNEPAR